MIEFLGPDIVELMCRAADSSTFGFFLGAHLCISAHILGWKIRKRRSNGES